MLRVCACVTYMKPCSMHVITFVRAVFCFFICFLFLIVRKMYRALLAYNLLLVYYGVHKYTHTHSHSLYKENTNGWIMTKGKFGLYLCCFFFLSKNIRTNCLFIWIINFAIFIYAYKIYIIHSDKSIITRTQFELLICK